MEERNEQQEQVEKSACGEVCSGSIRALNRAPAPAKRPISEKKLAANRANSQRSTGPTTMAGKAKAARNSLKHGFCANHLLGHAPQGPDGAEFEMLKTEIRQYYLPQEDLEELLVDKVAIEMLRYLRIIQQEKEALLTNSTFERNRLDLILRYAASNDRQLRHSIRELERIQTARKADSAVGDLLDLMRGEQKNLRLALDDQTSSLETPNRQDGRSCRIHG